MRKKTRVSFHDENVHKYIKAREKEKSFIVLR